jgi:hypothetical protein
MRMRIMNDPGPGRIGMRRAAANRNIRVSEMDMPDSPIDVGIRSEIPNFLQEQ